MTVTVPLRDVCSFQNGGTPSKSVHRYFEGQIPWITAADITSPVVTTARSYITNEAIENSATNLVPRGTVLLVTRTSVGKVATAGIDLCFSQDITAISPDSSRVHPPYLVEFLRTREAHFERLARGATIRGLTREMVSELKIPLPPLPEQRRIAEILDRAETLRAKRRATLAQLDTLTQSIFLEMFDDPGTNPKGWHQSSVGAVAFVYVPTRDKPKRFSGTIPWVTLPDIDGLFLSGAKSLLTVEDAAEVGNRLIPANSVLLSCAATLGEVAVTTVPVFTNQQFYALTPTDNVITAEFLALSLRLKGKHFFERLGGSFTIGFFSKQRASEISVPLPPFELQLEFSTRVRTVESLRQVQQSALSELDTLFASIQSKAFRGEL